MATRKLEQQLIELLPRARRYSRALIGSTEIADNFLLEASHTVVKNAPSIPFILTKKMVLPWLLIELHNALDNSHTQQLNKPESSPDKTDVILHEKIDSGLESLSKLQKRTYLLIALEQFQLKTTARILGQPIETIQHQFQQAHNIIDKHVIYYLETR